MSILREVKRICNLVLDNGGTAWLVGGSTRDLIMQGNMDNVKDFDIEVFGISPKELQIILNMYYDIDLVGQSFGVIKLKGLPIDVSIPRRESKQGTGHTGFIVHSDPSMSLREAAERRDFTMNAIYYDPIHEVFQDPYKGIEDIKHRRLEPVSEKFKEDPLRVLRAMQFIARFDLTPTQTLMDYCYVVSIENLSKERIFDEWSKMILKGKEIGKGLKFLADSHWIMFFPELAALQGVQQSMIHHPEGDVFVHTCHVMDAFAKHRTCNDWEDLVVGFAALTHDFGKATTTIFEDGRWKAPGHAKASVPLARMFLERMTNREELISQVLPLVYDHMTAAQLYESEPTDAAIRRISIRIDGKFERLAALMKADTLGRPPIHVTEFPEIEWLLDRADKLAVKDSKPKPIIMGRHLVMLGVDPGPKMGSMLNELFELQLEGYIFDEESGLALANQMIHNSPKEARLVPAEEQIDG